MKRFKQFLIATSLLAAIGALVLLLFHYAVRTNVVSRVSLPGTSLALAVTADVSGSYYCQLFDVERPISKLRPLGPYASRSCSVTHLSVWSNLVSVGWIDGTYRYNVTVDTKQRQLLDSTEMQQNSTP